jgi:hypothetical protein
VVGMAITAGSLHLSADRTLVPFLALLFVFFSSSFLFVVGFLVHALF